MPLVQADHLVEVLLLEALNYLMRNVAVPIDWQVPLSAESVLHVLIAVHMDFASADHFVQIPLSNESLLTVNHELIRVMDQNKPLLPGARPPGTKPIPFSR